MRCPECNEPVPSGDRFCEACGHDLGVARLDTTPVPATLPCVRCEQPPDADPDYCPGCGLRRPDGTDRYEFVLLPTPSAPDRCAGLAGVSDRGLVHARNEDAMSLGRTPAAGPPSSYVVVVCDGVSSVRRPEVASRTATAAALTVLLAPPTPDAGPPMPAAVAAAQSAVAALAPGGGPDTPSCTLVSALVTGLDGERPTVTIGWVGDSRAYWLAATGSRLLTADHSWAAEEVRAGRRDMATAMADRRAHGITRWLGADGYADPGIEVLTPDAPGVLLLCSDGLWNHLPDAEDLAAVALPLVAESGPAAAAAALTAIALEAGGRDNITVVVVPLPPLIEPAEPPEPVTDPTRSP
ncbi:PP2C family serine/threonine-protein phosphatase [Pseudonocardia sp. GCM10023141]|uniref:PP2C family serine/threonine-protein phosphatase n=1 Tax=Pseudonocardia sp. GCM10023141 TaxID=3252653 RepID=UPI00360D01D8